MKKLMLVAGGLGVLAVVWFTLRYLNIGSESMVSTSPTQVTQGARSTAQVGAQVPTEIIEVATGLNVPWDAVFTSPDRLLVTERSGAIRELVNGELQERPLIEFSEVAQTGEAGLMGLAADPNYGSTQYLYACLAYSSGGELYTKVERLVDQGEQIVRDRVLIDQIPAAQFHAGCRVAFGPDGLLYVTTGDATDGQLAQDTSSLAGKILRLNSDGSIPEDNPFGNAVWSYGHRNPQGISWHPSGVLFQTEHGPSGFDGPGGGDEVNTIESGKNYGWPVVSHQKSRSGMVDPLLVFTPAEAPGSVLVYTGTALPQFQNDVFFGALRGQKIVRIRLNPDSPQEVLSFESLPGIEYGRIRTVFQGPDGLLYFMTSNRDGRGETRAGDDRILRLQPVQ